MKFAVIKWLESHGGPEVGGNSLSLFFFLSFSHSLSLSLSLSPLLFSPLFGFIIWIAAEYLPLISPGV